MPAAAERDLRILDSTFLNNGRDQIGAHDIYVRHLTKALIEGNRIEGGSNHGIVLHGSSKDVVIRRNDIVGNSNGIGVNGGYSEAESFDRITIEQNLIHGNGFRAKEQGYALLLDSMTNSVIRNNLIYGNRLGSLSIQDRGSKEDAPTAGVQFYHNTILGQPAAIGYRSPDMKAIAFKNNIVVGVQKDAALPDAEIDLDSNLYLPGPGELASRLGKERNGLVGEPRFVDAAKNDFHVQAGSPAIGKGAPVGVADDFESRPRDPKAPTIGAYEAGQVSRHGRRRASFHMPTLLRLRLVLGAHVLRHPGMVEGPVGGGQPPGDHQQVEVLPPLARLHVGEHAAVAVVRLRAGRQVHHLMFERLAGEAARLARPVLHARLATCRSRATARPCAPRCSRPSRQCRSAAPCPRRPPRRCPHRRRR